MPTPPKTPILCVDDEPQVLRGLRLQLRRHFDVHVANSGQEGLDVIAGRETPFAVVVSDMRMPGMNGADFLSRVREVSPDSVRILLTGQSALTAAVDAVNKGGIFRFLCKPCPPPDLIRALNEAVRQHDLVVTERVLTEGTLRGAVSMMAETLALVSPEAFGRAARQRRVARDAAEALGLPDPWKLELAAMMSQLGFVSMPDDMRARIFGSLDRTAADDERVRAARRQASRLVKRIPRLEDVAEIIDSGPTEDEDIQLARQVLRASEEFVACKVHRLSPHHCRERLEAKFAPEVAVVLLSARTSDAVRGVSVLGLIEGMVFAEDVMSTTGKLLLASGHEVTEVVRDRLQMFHKRTPVLEPLMIYADPSAASADIDDELASLPVPPLAS